MMKTDWASFASGAAAATAIGLLLPLIMRAAPETLLNRPKTRAEKAFVLAVELQFTNEEEADALMTEWTIAADWCYLNEPFLFHYEAALSDKDPLKYLIYERYHNKASYLGAHKLSTAFNQFRPKMKALQDAGKVVVTGQSWNELGIGFV